jgi:hypothetical protein
MNAQPQFDFSPPKREDNVSLEGLDDFLEITHEEEQEVGHLIQGESKSSSDSEIVYIFELMEQVLRVQDLLELTGERLTFAQARVAGMEMVLQKQTEQLAVMPYYQTKIVELEKRVAELSERNEELEHHWLRRVFAWFL